MFDESRRSRGILIGLLLNLMEVIVYLDMCDISGMGVDLCFRWGVVNFVGIGWVLWYGLCFCFDMVGK